MYILVESEICIFTVRDAIPVKPV